MSERKEIIKIKVEINEIESETIKKSIKQAFPLTRSDQSGVGVKTLITSIMHKRSDITTDPTDIKIIRKYCKQLYVNKFNNLN